MYSTTPAPSAPLTSRGRLALWTASLLVAILMSAYYWCLVVNVDVATDLQAHIDMLMRVCSGENNLPANAGFLAVTWLLTGLSCDKPLLLKMTVPVVGAAWGAVVYVSGRTAVRTLNPLTGTTSYWPAVVAAVFSCVLFPLPIEEANYYLGLLPPNVFHNSTLITSLPFAVAAFALGLTQLLRAAPAQRLNVALAAALVAGAWFKPSYAFGFVPAYGLLSLLRAGFRPAALLARLWPLLPLLLFIAGQSWWIAQHPEDYGGGTSFVLAFPAGWAMFRPEYTTEEAWLAFATSFGLPILAYVLQPQWLRRPSHQLALLTVLAAFAQFMLVHEEGDRAGHGNFIWQVVASSHILYWLILYDALVGVTPRQSWLSRLRLVVLLLALAACAVSGGVYLHRIPIERTYF